MPYFVQENGGERPNAMHANNCSLVRQQKEEEGFSDKPSQTKTKPPNALYAKYPISFFWGGHSQNDLTIKK